MVAHYSIAYHGLHGSHGSIYDDVCQMRVNHVKQRYGTAVLVFDGYTNEPSTKDAIHLIRTRTCSGVTVHFTVICSFSPRKMSSWQIRKIKHVLDSPKQDADMLIVQTTVASAQTKHTILVGDDTDLLVLLLHRDIDASNIFVSPENTQTSKPEKVWCIQQCTAW